MSGETEKAGLARNVTLYENTRAEGRNYTRRSEYVFPSKDTSKAKGIETYRETRRIGKEPGSSKANSESARPVYKPDVGNDPRQLKDVKAQELRACIEGTELLLLL